MRRLLLAAVLLAGVGCAASTSFNPPLNVTIAATGPATTSTSTYFIGGAHCCVAMSLAVDDLNARPASAIVYTLNFTNNAAMQSRAVRAVAAQLSLPIDGDTPAPIGIVSDYYSSITEAVQYLLAGFHVPQIGYGSTDTALSDKSTYPYFLRTALSDATRGATFMAILQHFRWQEVAMISFNEAFSQSLRQSFSNALRSASNTTTLITLLLDYAFADETVKDPEDVISVLEQIQALNLHVILLMGVPTSILPVLNIVAGANKTGPEYQWIVADFEDSQFPGVIDVQIGTELTTVYEQLNFTNRMVDAILNNRYPACNPTGASVGANIAIDTFAPAAYDAVSCFALAVDNILEEAGSQGPLNTTSANRLIHNSTNLLQTLLALNFTGASGQVSFNANGDVTAGAYNIVLYVDSQTQQMIGTVSLERGRVVEESFLPDDQVHWQSAAGPVLAPLLCNPGYEPRTSNITSSFSCAPCVQGFFSPDRGSKCFPCTAGSVSREPASVTCAICTNGTHSTADSTDCIVCDTSSYAPTFGLTQCIPCPPNSSTNTLGATSLSDCVCHSGFFANPNATSLECIRCAQGAVCDGTILPYAADGYYQDDVNIFFICYPSWSCVNNTCVPPLMGPLCASCDNGLYYDPDSNSCVNCSLAGSVCLIIFLGMFIVFLVYLVSRLRKRDYQPKNDSYSSTLPRTGSKLDTVSDGPSALTLPWSYGRALVTDITLLVAFIQIQSIIGDFALKSSPTQDMFVTLQFSLGDLEEIYACLFLPFSSSTDPFEAYWTLFQWKLSFPLLIPLFLLFFWLLDLLHWAYINLCHGLTSFFASRLTETNTTSNTNSSPGIRPTTDETASTWLIVRNYLGILKQAITHRMRHLLTRYTPMSLAASINTLLMLGDFLYLFEVHVALAVFDCYEQPNGTWSLLNRPSIFCYTGAWLPFSRSAYAAAVLYGLGVPLLFAICLSLKYYRDRRDKKDPAHTKHAVDYSVAFATLVDNYNPNSFWWHLVTQLKKIFVSVIVGFIDDVGVRTLVALAGMSFILSLTLFQRPFLFRTGQFLECSSLVAHMCVLLLGLLQNYDIPVVGVVAEAVSVSDMIINDVAVAVFAVTCALFAAIMIYDLWRIMRSTSDSWLMERQKSRREPLGRFATKYHVHKSDDLVTLVEKQWEDIQIETLSVIKGLQHVHNRKKHTKVQRPPNGTSSGLATGMPPTSSATPADNLRD